MRRTPAVSRARRWLLLPLSVTALLVAASCAPPPEPSDPNTPWLEPGCLDSELPGVPDFDFNGRANVKDNATAYLDAEGNYVEDGSCTGVTSETGTIVRAATHAGAITACVAAGVPVHDPGRLVDFGYNAPIDGWACANVSAAPEIIEFSGPATVNVTMTADPEAGGTTVPFTGTVQGIWDQNDGSFSVGLTVDDGFFAANTDLGLLDIYYTAAQAGSATGSFDFATGEGGFSLGVDMTLVGINGPTGMPQPCVIGTAFDFTGAIDLDTGLLSVSQSNFTITPPAAADCGTLGGMIADMLLGGTNEADMGFRVLPAAT